jgi:hypothetical protein
MKESGKEYNFQIETTQVNIIHHNSCKDNLTQTINKLPLKVKTEMHLLIKTATFHPLSFFQIKPMLRHSFQDKAILLPLTTAALTLLLIITLI